MANFNPENIDANIDVNLVFNKDDLRDLQNVLDEGFVANISFSDKEIDKGVAQLKSMIKKGIAGEDIIGDAFTKDLSIQLKELIADIAKDTGGLYSKIQGELGKGNKANLNNITAWSAEFLTNLKRIQQLAEVLPEDFKKLSELKIGNISINFDSVAKDMIKLRNDMNNMLVKANKIRETVNNIQTKKNGKGTGNGKGGYEDLISLVAPEYETLQKAMRNNKYDWNNKEQVASDYKQLSEIDAVLRYWFEQANVKNVSLVNGHKFSINKLDIIKKGSKTQKGIWNNVDDTTLFEAIDRENEERFKNEKELQEFLNNFIEKLYKKNISESDNSAGQVIQRLEKYSKDEDVVNAKTNKKTAKQENFETDKKEAKNNLLKKVSDLEEYRTIGERDLSKIKEKIEDIQKTYQKYADKYETDENAEIDTELSSIIDSLEQDSQKIKDSILKGETKEKIDPAKVIEILNTKIQSFYDIVSNNGSVNEQEKTLNEINKIFNGFENNISSEDKNKLEVELNEIKSDILDIQDQYKSSIVESTNEFKELVSLKEDYEKSKLSTSENNSLKALDKAKKILEEIKTKTKDMINMFSEQGIDEDFLNENGLIWDNNDFSKQEKKLLNIENIINNIKNNIEETGEALKEATVQGEKFNDVINEQPVNTDGNTPIDGSSGYVPPNTPTGSSGQGGATGSPPPDNIIYITKAVLADDIPEQIQEQLNKFGFTIYITKALLSEDSSTVNIQEELNAITANNPVKVEVNPNIVQNSEASEENSDKTVSVDIDNASLSAEAIQALKLQIETALSPIFIKSIEINQENIDNIKEQIQNVLHTFTIDKIEFNSKIDTSAIYKQINTMLSSIQMPPLDYSSNAKALKTELENALAQVTMSNDSISKLVPDNTVNDLEIINKMSSALENLKRVINSINRSITRISQNIADRNSGIVSNMEADMSKLQNLIDQVDKLKQSIDSIGNIKNIVVTIQNTNNNPLSETGSKVSSTSGKVNDTSVSTNSAKFIRYYNLINNKISELNKAVKAGDIDQTFAKNCIAWLNNLKKSISGIEKGKESVNYKKLIGNDTFKDFKLASQDMLKEIVSVLATIDTDTKTNKIANYYNAIDKDIKEIEKAKVKIGTQTGNDYISKLNTFKEAFKSFQEGSETVEFGEGANKELLDLTQTIERYKELITEIQNNKFDATVGTSLNKVERNYNSLIAKVREWGQENSRALKDKHIAAQYNKILSELSNTTDISAEKVEKLSAAFNRLNAQALTAGKTGRSFSGEMKHLLNILGDRAIVGSVLEYLKDGFREMLNNTREIDAAMTDLKKVTDNSSGRYAQFLKEAGTEAKNLGSTIANLTTSTAGFAKLGYNIDESQTLAKNAIVYSNVGDLDIETATNDLVSATKAFDLNADETGKIVDSFNEVGNRFAVSAKQLGEGLNSSASTLYMSGNTIDESIAMLTAMTEVTQDASSAGAALKIFALRVRGAKTELAEMGEDTEGMATSTSKLREEIKGLTGGFDIMEDDSTFKSTMNIARGLSEAMEKMNDIDRTALLEKVAGKNRANQIGALLNNFSQAEKALEVSKESAGSAAKENAAYIDSIQGRINQMKASFEDLSIDFFDSEDIKLVIQGLTKIIDLVDKIVEFTGGGPLLALGLTSFMKMRGGVEWDKLPDIIKSIPSTVTDGISKIKNSKLGQFIESDWNQTKEDVSGLFETIIKGIADLGGEDASDIFDNINEEVQQLGENKETVDKVSDAVEGVGESAEEAGKGVKALGAGFKGLLVQLGISIIIGIISKIVDSIETVEKLREKVDEVSKDYQDVIDNLEDVNSQIEENKKLIEEINSNPLTITSKEDLKRLQNENGLLEGQKKLLEFEEKSKAIELAKTTTKFLNKKGYSYSEEKGIEEGGVDTYLGATQNFIDDYTNNINEFNSIDWSKPTAENIDSFMRLNNLIKEQQSQLINISNTLFEHRQNLDENSDLYQQIGIMIDNIKDKTEEFSNKEFKFNIPQMLNDYNESDPEFYKKFEEYSKKIEKFKKKYGEKALNSSILNNSTDDIDDDIKKIFEKHNIDLYSDETTLNQTWAFQKDSDNIATYEQIYDVLVDITTQRQKGLIVLNEENAAIEQQLKNILGLGSANIDDYAYLENLRQFHSQLSAFFESDPKDEFNSLFDVNSSNYFDFIKKLTGELEKQDFDISLMDEYFSSIFPSYQDIDSWLMSYYNEGHAEEINDLINKTLFGEDIDISPNKALLTALDEMGISADEASKYLINLKNSIIAEKASADKAKSQEIELDFNQKKSDFDGNANPTLSMFESAINSAQAAFSNQATVAYEDMWTMIQTDESLVDSFTKTANGYAISVDVLREAKERYIATVKNGLEKDRQDTLTQIKISQDNIEEANRVLNSPTADGKQKSKAEKIIQEENKVIAEQEVILAKVNLQLEEVNGQTVDYANSLDEITSKLSSWESIYQSIINDMSKINKLSSSTLQAIMKAAPNNWQDIVYLDDNNQIQADQQKLFEFANQDLINNVKTQQKNLNEAVSEQANSLFKSKYGVDLGVDLELTGDYEKDLENIKKRVSEAIGKADYRQLSSIKGGIDINGTLEELTPNIEEASEGVKIFIALLEALFGEFEENKALTDFNSDIEKLQHSLSMGSINQTQYNSAYAGKVSEFENAVRADGSIDTAETQDQLNQMYETIHSNRQSELSKLLEKEKQSIQDAYDQRLITAEQYYTQLTALEDRYYGTNDSKGLLDDPDGTNVEEALREQIERRRELYDDEKALLQDKYDKGLIDFDTFESELNRIKNEWLNIPELKVTFDEESFDNTNILYDAELANIEQLGEENKLTNTQTAAEMRRIWEKYYKDKEGFAKESYEAEKRYLEAAKNDIQDQINGIQDLMDINSDFIDRQTKILEDQNDEITKAYDEQISLIDKQIDAIDEQIDAIQDKADEEDRYYQIQKAEDELRNASQRTRMVYGSDGTVSYRVDTEKQQEALKNYNDAKKDLVIAELEKQKDAMEKDKEKLEEQKEAALEVNNNKIEELNEQLKTLNAPLEDLVAILSANLAETYGFDPNVIFEALGTNASQRMLDRINEARKASGEKEITLNDLKSTAEQGSKDYKDKTVPQTTKDDQIKQVNENVTKEENGVIKVGEGLYEVLGNLPLEELNSNLAALLSSNVNISDPTTMLATNNNSMLNNTIDPKIADMGSENMAVTGQQPNTFTIGDIVINSPVGDSNDLAKELRLNLQNAFEKQMYSNLK